MRIKVDLENEIVPADGTLGCLLSGAASSVRRRFFQPSDKKLACPYRFKWASRTGNTMGTAK
jgi:hypothetical protein